MKLRWSRGARFDLRAIKSYIARDDPAAADRWIKQLRRRARKAATMPLAGRAVSEFGLPELREVLLGNYRLVYLVRREEIFMLTVLEGHRLLPDEILEADD